MGETKGISLGRWHTLTTRRLFAPWWIGAAGWLAAAWLFLLEQRVLSGAVLALSVVAVVVVVGMGRSTTTTTTTKQSAVKRGAYSRWSSRRRRVE